MAKEWYMLTMVGRDRPGIVSRVTAALYDGGCNLGEATMARLGGNFTIMLMVQFDGPRQVLIQQIEPVVQSLDLQVHIDSINAELHQHLIPDVRITVYGADRLGIVAQATTALTDAGLNILDLDSDVAGTAEQPIYVMTIEGVANEGIASLQAVLDILSGQGIETSLSAIETMLG